jgi:thiol-disulfide isomerase/thioredoxin
MSAQALPLVIAGLLAVAVGAAFELRGGPPTQLPSFAGATGWLNSGPLAPADLRGKVVLVDIWTFTCINWLRTMPYLRAWEARYKDRGLVIVGVHAPEFGIEKNLADVRRSVGDFGVRYPVAVDNDFAIWRSLDNQYWPALYLYDGKGRLRHRQFGEDGYEQAEQILRQLLEEAGGRALDGGPTRLEVRAIETPADSPNLGSPETYAGYNRAERFASPGGAASDRRKVYRFPDVLALNQWALAGGWTVGVESIVPNDRGARIAFRFHARDLNLVLAPASSGTPLRFRVTIDGKPPGAARGADVDDAGLGAVIEPRLYQLIRQPAPVVDRRFEIEFLDPGASVFSFTFG